MNNLKEYILEKFKIHKGINIKDNDLYIVIPYAETEDYMKDNYKDYYVYVGYNAFLLNEDKIKKLINLKKWKDNIETYEIPVKDKEHLDTNNLKEFADYMCNKYSYRIINKLTLNKDLSYLVY